MKKILFLFLFPCMMIFGQEESVFNNQHSVGFGLGNTLELLKNINKEPTFKNTPSLFLDYKKNIDSTLFYRFYVCTKILDTNSNDNVLEFKDLFIATGIEKNIRKIKSDRIRVYYGLDVYYKMNLRRYKISLTSGSAWNAEMFGFGLLAVSGIEFSINNYLCIASELNAGLGLQQIGVNNNIGIIQWNLMGVSSRNLSVGLRYYFNSR